MEWNGIEWNGTEQNGIERNETEQNGMQIRLSNQICPTVYLLKSGNKNGVYTCLEGFLGHLG